MISADEIREHMEVLAQDGAHVGTVDHMDGESRIKLTRNASSDGQHHYIPLDWVDHAPWRQDKQRTVTLGRGGPFPYRQP